MSMNRPDVYKSRDVPDEAYKRTLVLDFLRFSESSKMDSSFLRFTIIISCLKEYIRKTQTKISKVKRFAGAFLSTRILQSDYRAI